MSTDELKERLDSIIESEFAKIETLLGKAAALVPDQTKRFVQEFEKGVNTVVSDGKQEEVSDGKQEEVKKPTRVPVKKARLGNLNVRRNSKGICTFVKGGRLFSSNNIQRYPTWV